jgi:hypothetical protein
MIVLMKENWTIKFDPTLYEVDLEIQSTGPIDDTILGKMRMLKRKKWGFTNLNYRSDNEYGYLSFRTGETTPMVIEKKYVLEIGASGRINFQKHLHTFLKKAFGDQWVQ